MNEMLIDLADFITQARTPVERDFKDNIILVPDFEMPMRVYSMFQKMVQTMIHISDKKEFTEAHKKAIIGLAFDSIPKQIMLPLKLLAKHKAMTTKGAAQELNYPSDTVLKWLQNINVNKICDRRQVVSGKPDMWVMRDEYKELMQKYMGIKPDEELLMDPDTEEGFGNDINPTWMLNKFTDDPVEKAENDAHINKMFDAI
jgi:predicted transcriptional regulator